MRPGSPFRSGLPPPSRSISESYVPLPQPDRHGNRQLTHSLHPQICACAPALRPLITRYVTPAFSTITTRISSFVSRSSSTATTLHTSNPASGPCGARKTYHKFSSTSSNAAAGSSTTLKASKLSSKHSAGSRLRTTDTTTTTTTVAADHDSLSFITLHPTALPSASASTSSSPSTPHHPLQILYHQSFELAHLDRPRPTIPADHDDDNDDDDDDRDEGDTSAHLDHHGGGGGGETLDLDPREREAGGRAAFGCVAEVSCPRCGGGEEPEGGPNRGLGGRRRSFGWGGSRGGWG